MNVKNCNFFDLSISWVTQIKNKVPALPECHKLQWGCYNSQFGPALIIMQEDYICGLSFIEYKNQKVLKKTLEKQFEPSLVISETKLTKIGNSIFNFKGNVKLKLIGSAFQISVWTALFDTQPGETICYSCVAHKINNLNAVRAVGSAIGRNPIGLLIPCHRVIKKSGEIGNYYWGTELKKCFQKFELLRNINK